ncbi:MAG TPA: ATP-binding protein, partial [Anaerolineae bacterium]|nr:ATP-binding protein [Anaerolineae bacterium]
MNKLPKKIPLIIVLVVSIVSLNVLAVSLVGYLSFQNGQRAVNDVADTLRREITFRIEEHLETFLHVPQQINETNSQLLRQEVLRVNDPEMLERHFWEQIQIFDSVSSIYFGNTAGGMANAGREGEDGFLYVIATDDFKQGAFRKFETDDEGERGELLLTMPNFDARTRPWYQGAVVNEGVAWSEAYILFTGQDMAIAVSQPVYNRDEALVGVVSVDLFLSQLNDFLQEIEIGQSGQAFIVERSGLLVATSTEEKPFSEADEGGGRRRFYATESGSPLIRAAGERLVAEYGDYAQIDTAVHLEFELEGERQFVRVLPLAGEEGLDWLVVVVIPEADFMTYIEANNRTTVILIVLTLISTVLISIYISHKVTEPILQLNKLANKLAKGELRQTTGRDTRIREISSVMGAFDDMATELARLVAELTGEVAERKRAELVLRRSEENLRITLDSIGDAVIATDAEGLVTRMNPVAEKLTGWLLVEAEGKSLGTIFQIVDEQTRQEVVSPVEQVLAVGGIVELAENTVLIAKDGSERLIADSGAPIRDSRNKLIGVVLVFRDVTEEIQTKAELLKVKKLESLSILAGGIAHDFNNLLAGLYGYVDLAEMYLDKEHRAYQYLQKANQSMEQATHLTHQLLTFAKGGEPIKRTFSIREVIVETAQFSLRGSNVRLETDIARDLWLVKADKGQLSQVISNLVINAQEAMPRGGTVTITAQNEVVDGEMCIKVVVQDEGEGIEPQYLEQIFDPYFSTKERGSGLGLASAYSIVQKHGGRIGVDSVVGEGTCFVVYLPAEGEGSVVGDEITLEEQILQKSLAELHILVLDDEALVRQVIGTMLEQLGSDVTYAMEGQEAIDKYEAAYRGG